MLASCPDYSSLAEGKSSLINSLFNFCSVHHDGDPPIRLLHEDLASSIFKSHGTKIELAVDQTSFPLGVRKNSLDTRLHVCVSRLRTKSPELARDCSLDCLTLQILKGSLQVSYLPSSHHNNKSY